MRVAPGLPQDLDRSDRRAGSRFFALFFGDLQQRLERLAGVSSAAAVSLGPLEGVASGFGNIAVNGRKTSSEESFTPVAFVTPGYFRTMRIPLVGGRDFTQDDRLGAGLVAIVNEAFQRRFAPGGDILGARVTSGSGPEAFTIVGVAEDVPDRSLRQAPEPLLIAPFAQMPGVHLSWSALTFVLRTTEGDPLRLAPDVRRTIWAINPNIVINEIATMDARVAVAMRAERDSALLFGLFAVAALVMAAIGVYGVASYTIVQRTKEIGIRVALGAARRDVKRLVVIETLLADTDWNRRRYWRRGNAHATCFVDGVRRHASGSSHLRRGCGRLVECCAGCDLVASTTSDSDRSARSAQIRVMIWV